MPVQGVCIFPLWFRELFTAFQQGHAMMWCVFKKIVLEAAWVELMIKGTEGRAEGEINSTAGDKEGGQELRWELGVQRQGYLGKHCRGWDGRKKNPQREGANKDDRISVWETGKTVVLLTGIVKAREIERWREWLFQIHCFCCTRNTYMIRSCQWNDHACSG